MKEIENRLDEMAYTLAERQSQDVIESYSYSVKFNITTNITTKTKKKAMKTNQMSIPKQIAMRYI